MYEKESQIGFIIIMREGKIMEGMPEDQAWGAYFRELEKITGLPYP